MSLAGLVDHEVAGLPHNQEHGVRMVPRELLDVEPHLDGLDWRRGPLVKEANDVLLIRERKLVAVGIPGAPRKVDPGFLLAVLVDAGGLAVPNIPDLEAVLADGEDCALVAPLQGLDRRLVLVLARAGQARAVVVVPDPQRRVRRG